MSSEQPFTNGQHNTNQGVTPGVQMQQPIQPQVMPVMSMVAPAKSLSSAYLLCIFLGGLGIHKFYLNQTGMGILYIVLTVIGWSTLLFFIGVVPLLVLGVLIIVDLVKIPEWVNNANGVVPMVGIQQ